MSEQSPPESSSAIGTIYIKEVKDVDYVSIDMDVEDEAYDKLVAIGKEEATDKDYFRIGFTSVLKEYLDRDRHKESSEIIKGCIRQSLGNELTEEEKQTDA